MFENQIYNIYIYLDFPKNDLTRFPFLYTFAPKVLIIRNHQTLSPPVRQSSRKVQKGRYYRFGFKGTFKVET